jgi:hypothetical protein
MPYAFNERYALEAQAQVKRRRGYRVSRLAIDHLCL